MRVTLYPSQPCGNVLVPSSKSAGHRALICAALAKGESRLQNPGDSDDIAATLRVLAALGAGFRREGDTLRVNGISALPRDSLTLDCGESGSTLRFLIPLCSLAGADCRLVGQGRLLERPQEVYAALFAERGLAFSHTPEAVTLRGALTAGEYELRGDVSSQFISGLLFALPLLKGDSRIRILPPFESRPYVELTLRAMADFGVTAAFSDSLTLAVPGGQHYCPRPEYAVEGDFSQLAFWAVLGTLRGDISCTGVWHDSVQGDRAILAILRDFGARYDELPNGYHFRESPTTGRELDLSDCPDLGPVLMVLAARSAGVTVLRNAGRLRLKESDRIAAMESELRRCGAEVSSTADSVTLRGNPNLAPPECTLSCHNDHRVAMSLAVLAAACGGGPVTLEGAECVSKSYPRFFDDLRAVGGKFDAAHDSDFTK